FPQGARGGVQGVHSDVPPARGPRGYRAVPGPAQDRPGQAHQGARRAVREGGGPLVRRGGIREDGRSGRRHREAVGHLRAHAVYPEMTLFLAVTTVASIVAVPVRICRRVVSALVVAV